MPNESSNKSHFTFKHCYIRRSDLTQTRNIRIVRVIDGDTFVGIDVTNDDQTITKDRYRLGGIDANELDPKYFKSKDKAKQHYHMMAVKATTYLKEILKINYEFITVHQGIDTFGRKLVFPIVNGCYLNVIMVKKGLAKVYRLKGAVYLHLKKELLEAEKSAKLSKIGIHKKFN